MLFIARGRRFSCAVSAEGLVIAAPPLTLRYDQIQEIWAPARKRTPEAFVIHVFHEGGACSLPAKLNVPSIDVYRFLASQPLSLADDRTVPSALAGFLRLQESLFGAGKVWVFRPRVGPRPRAGNRYGLAICAAICLSGLVWTGLAAAKIVQDGGWLGAGLACAFLGFLLGILFWAANFQTTRVKNWRQSGLVVSPGGIALVQGPLKGELKWREVRGLKMRRRGSFTFTWGKEQGIGLAITVAGATIFVADIYHRPLEYIHRLMQRFWERDQDAD
jgi:hypothetical protein